MATSPKAETGRSVPSSFPSSPYSPAPPPAALPGSVLGGLD